MAQLTDSFPLKLKLCTYRGLTYFCCQWLHMHAVSGSGGQSYDVMWECEASEVIVGVGDTEGG